MKYAELIKRLQPYSDEEVFFDGFENAITTEVVFHFKDEKFVKLSRRYGEDEVSINQPKNERKMKAKLKTGETVEVIPNDDFCAAKWVNKETSEYIFDDEIEELISAIID